VPIWTINSLKFGTNNKDAKSEYFSHFHDGGYDVISRNKVLPPVDLVSEHGASAGTYAAASIYSTFVLVITVASVYFWWKWLCLYFRIVNSVAVSLCCNRINRLQCICITNPLTCPNYSLFSTVSFFTFLLFVYVLKPVFVFVSSVSARKTHFCWRSTPLFLMFLFNGNACFC